MDEIDQAGVRRAVEELQQPGPSSSQLDVREVAPVKEQHQDVDPKGPGLGLFALSDAVGRGIGLGCSSMPRPPALLIATASWGVVTPPIGACWIGTWQPTSWVNAVTNMMQPDRWYLAAGALLRKNQLRP